MLLTANFAVGQIEVTPNELLFVANGEDQLYQEFNVVNNIGSDSDVYWRFELGNDFPDDWTAQICDINLCYGWGTYQSAPSAPNAIADGVTVKFSVKVRRNDSSAMNGTSYGIIKFYDDPEFTNEIGSSSAPVTSTSDLDLSDLVIYPNPTTHSFQIKNDGAIASVSIYNIVGREVSTLNHSEGMVHDVSDLRSGMYLVRLVNAKGDVVKAMRLSKR